MTGMLSLPLGSTFFTYMFYSLLVSDIVVIAIGIFCDFFSIACLSVLAEGSFLYGSFCGFFYVFQSITWGFVFALLELSV